MDTYSVVYILTYCHCLGFLSSGGCKYAHCINAALTHSINKQGLNCILVSQWVCSRDLQATNLFSCICLDFSVDSYSHILVMALPWLTCLWSCSGINFSFFVSLLHMSLDIVFISFGNIPSSGVPFFIFLRNSQWLLFSTASPSHTKFTLLITAILRQFPVVASNHSSLIMSDAGYFL